MRTISQREGRQRRITRYVAGCLFVMTLPLAISGCSGCMDWWEGWFSATPTPQLSPSPTPTPQVAAHLVSTITNRDRLAAMLSIQAHARWPNALPPGILPLDEAIRILNQDTDPLAWSRKIRAVAMLAAYGRFGQRFSEEVQKLGGKLDGIKLAVERMPADSQPAPPPPAATPPAVAATPGPDVAPRDLEAEQLDVAASNAIVADPSLATVESASVQTCDPKTKVKDVGGGGASPAVDIAVEISVALPKAVVLKNVDPQRWDECSKFWDPPPNATYFVDTNAAGAVVYDPTSKRPRVDTTALPAPGSRFSGMFLFENFKCEASGCDSWFDIVLKVWAPPNETVTSSPSNTGQTNVFPADIVHYDLADPVTFDPPAPGAEKGWLDGNVAGTTVKILQDHGSVAVWEDGGRTYVRMLKTVQYDLPGQGGVVAGVLPYTELGGELAEIACCTGKAAAVE